jgi:hypothetical protein
MSSLQQRSGWTTRVSKAELILDNASDGYRSARAHPCARVQRIAQRLLSQARSDGSSFPGGACAELDAAQIFIASIFVRIVISA